MGSRDDSHEYGHFEENDPRLGPTYKELLEVTKDLANQEYSLRADIDEQARRIGMALGFTAEAIGDADEMADRQVRGSYNMQRTLRRIKRVLETGTIE